jgi:hypothetical protein
MTTEHDALRRAYGDLAHIAEGLDEMASWQPTRCAGWAVRDLVFHLLGDAQRALVALASPAAGPADRDAVTYWLDAPEAAVHHLDLVAHLGRRGPAPGPLLLVRRTLDGLLGCPVPFPWDGETWALVGTGRRPLTETERLALGSHADRLPLLH